MPKKPVALVTARKPSYLESSGRKQKTKKHKKNNFSLYPEFYMFWILNHLRAVPIP